MEIDDLQATVTAGSCSSRVIFNVPKARSARPGGRVQRRAQPSTSTSRSPGTSTTRSSGSTLTSTEPAVSVVSGIKDGNRLPTVPEVQIAASATYQRRGHGHGDSVT